MEYLFAPNKIDFYVSVACNNKHIYKQISVTMSMLIAITLVGFKSHKWEVCYIFLITKNYEFSKSSLLTVALKSFEEYCTKSDIR